MIIYQYTDIHGTKTPPVLVESCENLKIPATWTELHTFRPSADLAANVKWLRLFSFRVRWLSCKCTTHWRRYVMQHPPDYSSEAAWFSWTVQAHNAVNVRLKKPTLTLEQAQAVWHSKISNPPPKNERRSF